MVLRLQKSLECPRNFFYPWRHSKITLLYYLDIYLVVLYFQFLVIHMMTTRRSTTKYTTILFFHIKKINKSIFYILGWSLKCKIDRTISLKGKEAYFSTLPFLQQILSRLVLFFTKNNFSVDVSFRKNAYSKCIYTVLF